MTCTKVILFVVTSMAWFSIAADKEYKWKVHDVNRPNPPVVTPGATDDAPPSDAIVLFDGSDLSKWQSGNGGPAPWKVENGYMQVSGGGDIRTKEAFGSCQLHVEWAAPEEVRGSDQGRGNSGVFLMSTYEVQVLDCYGNKTYADGQTGAIYAQKPPMVNVCRAPGKWQSYDIIFHAPEFDGDQVTKPATITVLQNGVLIQDHWVIQGATEWKTRAHYTPHAAQLPLKLQDHGNPVRYRNIWIRPIPEPAEAE